VFKFKIEIL